MTRIFSDHDLAKMRNAAGENIPVPPPPRKRAKNEESQIQQAVIKWWAVVHQSFGIPEILLFSIPNGGWRSVVTATILKREGLRKGASDLFLAVKRGGFAGLFIEMKKSDGYLSEDQKEFQCEVTRQGYAAYACYSYDEAVKLITGYLGGQKLF